MFPCGVRDVMWCHPKNIITGILMLLLHVYATRRNLCHWIKPSDLFQSTFFQPVSFSRACCLTRERQHQVPLNGYWGWVSASLSVWKKTKWHATDHPYIDIYICINKIKPSKNIYKQHWWPPNKKQKPLTVPHDPHHEHALLLTGKTQPILEIAKLD